MSYQATATPRFFIDYLQYYRAIGLDYDSRYGADSNGTYYSTYTDYFWNLSNSMNAINNRKCKGTVGLNPAYNVFYKGVVDSAHSGWNCMNRLHSSFPVHELNCIGLLGHNLASATGNASFGYAHYGVNANGDSVYPYNQNADQEIKINCAGSGGSVVPTYDGFSFSSCGETNMSDVNLDSWGGLIVRGMTGSSLTTFEHRMGSQFWGRFYNMPTSPDLKLTMSIDMDGIKTKTTKGGSTLSNSMYTGPPDWGDMPPWTLSTNSRSSYWTSADPRVGRRTWNLSFSFLSDSDIFPSIAGHTGYEQSGGTGSSDVDTFQHEADAGQQNFYSQVWMKTMGGRLPFVFQPDKDNDSPDTFAICRFDMKSLKVTQSMHRKYNVKLKIRETW